MSVEPQDFLAIPFLFLIGISSVMILVGGTGGNVLWLIDVATALIVPILLASVIAGFGFTFYQWLK